MNFIDIYRFAKSAAVGFVSVELLRKKIESDHPVVNEVILFRCDLDPAVSRGHMVLFMDRTSAYEDQYVVASVRFSKSLNRCWRRFVCCKELMHVFDPSLSRTSDRSKFIELLSELENNPINTAASERFQSERIAEWQALFVLCPSNKRKEIKEMFDLGQITRNQIAKQLLIPEVYIGTILSERYEIYHELIVGEPV